MPLLVDQFGNPLRVKSRKGQAESSWGLYQTPRNSGEQDYYTEASWGLTDIGSALNDYDWTELIDLSRRVVAQLPILSHAVRQKNEYAIGDAWIPQYRGANVAWGEAAEDWLHNVWLPQCSHSGGAGDWQTDLFVSGVSWDVDGDDVALFVVDEDGMPKIAYRSAHQITSGGAKADVSGGKFDGAKICNGIIRDRNGRFLGIRLMRPDRKTSSGPGYDDIPASQCDLQYEPFWRVQHRGFPRLASALLDMLDVKDIKKFLKRGVKLDSSIGLMHFNEHGQADPNSDTLDEPADTTAGTHNAADVKIEKRYGGEILYMRANIGERLEALKTDRPASNAMAFYAGLERGGLLSLGWFRELIDPSAIGGASVRLIQDQARGSIKARQKTIRKRAYRCLYFAIGQAMQTGRIPANDSASDWMQWDFGLPAALTVDAGYDDQADERNLMLGTATMDSLAQKRGSYWQDNRAQRLTENMDLIEKAKSLMALANEGADPENKLSIRDAISLMQGSSNATGSPGWIMSGANASKPAAQQQVMEDDEE